MKESIDKNKVISNIFAYSVYDSRGWPTVACKVSVGRVHATAMIPSGASTGEKEAVELRDGDEKVLFGKTVNKAVRNINNKIAPKLIGYFAVDQQRKIDELLIVLDGTNNKSKLGANAILAVSLACAKCAAKVLKKPLYKYLGQNVAKVKTNDYLQPVPMLNVINGGAHADNTIDFQEFLILPTGAKNIIQALQMSSQVFHSLEKVLKSKNMNTNKGDEGGFAPNGLCSAEEVFDLLMLAVKEANLIPGKDIWFAIDAAASELYDKKTKMYIFKKALRANLIDEDAAQLTTAQMIKYWKKLVSKYPIISIEDGLDENDWEGFQILLKEIGNSVQIVGDDVFCTNPSLIAAGIKTNIANAVLIKVNQVGTLSETVMSIKNAIAAGWGYIISHRSGETEDDFIADLAIGLGGGQVKFGSMSRSERIAKYNRLISINYELGKLAHYRGLQTFKNIDLKTRTTHKISKF